MIFNLIHRDLAAREVCMSIPCACFRSDLQDQHFLYRSAMTALTCPSSPIPFIIVSRLFLYWGHLLCTHPWIYLYKANRRFSSNIHNVPDPMTGSL
ncbi:TPA: hypothetical protein GDO54_018444 [Pyxicephalus adspersus]|uniref:Uncharacterized protein n=1 Tax=Pyxicephalus adspersus TaxID=30357 RepID=A0AAV2ZTQ4_PYXAD|nr:TPA: hypothetical protein GDO54_018444 [Pyxicephalus adspersus]